MPINYPNIHSLSTLGIIYHFNSNYRFHSLRTDFSGEGGSGKTMIADMIQLILVGPGEYESATDANDDRPVEGIVLKPKNSQYGAGYVLLNIEISPKKYIAIGVFIEKSSKQARMFIIQAGFNWDEALEPLSKPIYYNELLVDGKILPIEELQHKLQNIHIKSLTLKHYHRTLYTNNILPVDLSENKKTLESYAEIFRSFSRGSGFKKDSDSLKVFLFGEDQKNFIEKYQTEVKSISDDYLEHDRYKKEIALINQKQGSIKDVVALEKSYKILKNTYLTVKVLYWNQRVLELQSALNKAKELYDKTRVEEVCINIREGRFLLQETEEQAKKYSISKEALSSIAGKKKIIQNEKETKFTLLQNAETKYKKVQLIEQLLLENENSLDKVKQKYLVEINYKEEKNLLQSFVLYLNQNQILQLFEDSAWLIDFTGTKKGFEDEMTQAKTKLEELKSLFDFADLQNPESLASWAINYFNEPLNIEQESVLVYFQKHPRQRKLFERYVSSPEELFQNLDIKDKTSAGFWINLDGIYEYINFVPKQYLNISVSKRKELERRLTLLTKDLKVEYSALEIKIKQAEHLKETLFNFPGLEQAIPLYKNRSNFKRNPNPAYTLLDQDQFEEHLTLYSIKDVINKEKLLAKRDYDTIVLSENDVDPNHYEQQFKDAETFFLERNVAIEKIGEYIAQINKKQEIQIKNLANLKKEINATDSQVQSIELELFKDSNTPPLITKLKSDHYRIFVNAEADYTAKNNELNKNKTNFDAALKEYQAELKKVFEFSDSKEQIVTNPDEGTNSLKIQYDKAKSEFEAKYNLIIEGIEEGEQLKNTFHTGQLAHKLLPTVFVSTVLEDETQLSNQLAERLNKLYQTIREIGSRKIEILKRVFTEVNKAYRDYLDKVNKIDLYFKNPNKIITGGNKASLKYMGSNDYPAKWMSVFNKILDDQINYTGLFEQLSEEIDINEMMKKAFINEGGTKEAKIEDLLDPKSYFDLAFELKLESGDNNSGSNSQTYTGNALLGLARLSLIGDANRPGIKIMPIDEAQGLGSNYEMLRNIAIEEKYQVLTMSIETAGNIIEGEQYIYILSENKLLDEDNYVPAMGIFSDNIITANINDFIDAEGN